MDVDMDDSLISNVDDNYDSPALEDQAVFGEYDNGARRASLESSDPVDDENDEAFMEEGEEYYDEDFDEDADSFVEEIEDGVTFGEIEQAQVEEQPLTVQEPDDSELPEEEFASKANDLAGVKEITEKEARSLRQGPAVTKKEKKAPQLDLGDFKALINHHLTATDWKFVPRADEEEDKIRVRGVKDLTKLNELGEAMRDL